MTSPPSTPPRELISVRADLDVPGETSRQARVFLLWLACLALAVAVSSSVGAHISVEDEGTPAAAQELSRSRAAKAKVALVFGLLLPALLTLVVGRRHRRGGAHPRGIIVDVTEEGELRLWGRGYGARVQIAGADVSERLVDVYAGRLGAWRQRRLRVRAGIHAPPGAAQEIEIAAVALSEDSETELGLFGGEGDCVELSREDFDRVRDQVLEVRRSARQGGQQS